MRNPKHYKEDYRLWIDCLRMSTDYKDLWEANALKPVKTVDEIFMDGIEKSISMSKGRKRLFPPERMCDVFGDVFDEDVDRFEKWWNDRMLPLLNLLKSSDKCIKDVSEDIPRCAEEIYTLFAEDRKDVNVENIATLLERYFGQRLGILPLRVFTCYPLTPTLRKKFNAIVRDHKRQKHIGEQQEEEFLGFIIPLPLETAKHRDKIRKYLRRYHMHEVEHKTWKQIIREQNLEEYIDEDNTVNQNGERVLKNDNKNIKHII